MSSVVNGPSRVAVCHINHAARCEYLFAMLRRSNDGNQRGSLLRSTRPGPLIGGTPLPSFLSATRTTAWCLVLEEGAADRLVSKRELPHLMKIGDDHDDALRRMVEAIERRTKYVHQ